VQADFAEPMVRINADPLDVVHLGWNESSAWDEIADYYSSQLPIAIIEESPVSPASAGSVLEPIRRGERLDDAGSYTDHGR
jgi:hypothetical protein